MKTVAEEKDGLSLYTQFVRKAYVNNSILVAIMKKILPDVKQVDMSTLIGGVFGLSYLSNEEIERELFRLNQTATGKKAPPVKRAEDTDQS